MKPRDHAAVLAIGLLVAACATPRLDGVAPGERISVEADARRDPLAIGIYRNNLGSTMGSGATGGAIAGMVAAASCGPFLFGFCVIAVTFASAGAGAGLGALYGATSSGLATDTETALGERAKARAATMEGELVATVRRKLGERWNVGPGAARTRLTIALERAGLVVSNEKLVSFSMNASVVLARDGRDAPEKRTYDYRSLAAHPDVWSENDGAYLDDALRKACDHIAEAIYLELAH